MAGAIARNLRYAARSLRKTPGFTAAVVLTLALATGANSAVFSALYAVLLRALPFPDRSRGSWRRSGWRIGTGSTAHSR